MSTHIHSNLRRLGTRQPSQLVGVNWRNPLTKNLVYLSNMACRAMDETGFVGASSAPTIAGNASFAQGPYGYSIQLTGAVNDAVSFRHVGAGGMPVDAASDGTIEVLCSLTGSVSRAHLFGIGDSAPVSGNTHKALIAFNGSSPFDIYFWDGAGGDVDTTVLYRVDGTLQHLIVCWGGGTQQVYRDGVLIKNASATMHGLGSQPYIYFGQQITSGTGTFTGHIYKAAIYGRKLDQDEVSALYADPWQQYNHLTSVRRELGITVGGGGGTPGRRYYDRFIAGV